MLNKKRVRIRYLAIIFYFYFYAFYIYLLLFFEMLAIIPSPTLSFLMQNESSSGGYALTHPRTDKIIPSVLQLMWLILNFCAAVLQRKPKEQLKVGFRAIMHPSSTAVAFLESNIDHPGCLCS